MRHNLPLPLLLFLFLLIVPFISLCETIAGRLINNNTNRPVSQVRVFLRLLNSADEPTGIHFEAITNELGEFEFNVPCMLPARLRFDVNDKNFRSSRVLRVQRGRKVEVRTTDDGEVAMARLIILKEHMEKEKVKMDVQVIPSVLADGKDTRLLDKLKDSLDGLSQSIEDMISQLNKGTIAAKKAEARADEWERENNRLQNEVVRLQGRIKVLEGDVWQAYLQFADVHCQGVSKDNKTLTFSFKVLDRDNNPVVNRDLAIRVVIEKLEGVKREGKSEQVMHESGETSYSTIVQSTPYVTVSFTARDKAFSSDRPNYTIKVYNTLFDDDSKAFIDQELWRLDKNCFAKALEGLTEIEGKKNEVVQTIELDNEQVILELKDYDVVDGDIISLLLNGEPVLTNVELKGDYEKYNLTLHKGINMLTLKSVSAGKNGPNTCAFRISDGGLFITGKLAETSSGTQSVKIVCQKR